MQAAVHFVGPYGRPVCRPAGPQLANDERATRWLDEVTCPACGLFFSVIPPEGRVDTPGEREARTPR